MWAQKKFIQRFAGTEESVMRHRVGGWKLGRNTEHRRALLRNLVTSLILEERIETTVPKAKAMKPQVEKMITLGKKGDLAARRLAGSYLMTRAAVDKLFEVAPRFGDREGGYTRIVLTGIRKGDGGQKAFIELLGAEKIIDAKREKRAETRAKRADELKKQMEAEQEAAASEKSEGGEEK
jgi:large subunit ribosomal protein L17